MKHFAIGALIVIALGCLGCGGFFMLAMIAGKPHPGARSAAPSAPVAPQMAEVYTSPRELIEAYRANEIAADARFRGKMVSISGTVADITRSAFDDTVVQMGDPNGFERVHATLSDGQQSVAAQLQRGQSVVVVGRCTGMIIGSPMIEDAIVRP